MAATSSARFVAAALLVLCASAARGVSADESRGVWSGDAGARLGYYWERSTRVVMPSVQLGLRSPRGLHIDADYLVDVITSASIAQTGSDDDAALTEYRHGVGAAAGGELDFRGGSVDVTGNARFSTEEDYTSISGGMTARVFLDQRATVLHAGLQGLRDKWDVSNPLHPEGVDPLYGAVAQLGWEQFLTPTLSWNASYDLVLLHGFLANPYRSINNQHVALVPEDHGDSRVRHSLSSGLAWYIAPHGPAVHPSLRGYTDSWGILAITPELRVGQELGDHVVLWTRYRYYRQSRASFYKEEAQYTPEDTEGRLTVDPKLSAFETHLIEGTLEVRPAFLEHTPLHFAHRAWFDLSLGRRFNTNRFGHGIIGQAGIRVPF